MKNYVDGVIIATMVEKLIGSITPTAETNHDKQVLDNLHTLFDIIDILLDDVQMSMYEAYKDKQYGSVEKIFEKEYDWLVNTKANIQEWIYEVEDGKN